MSDEAKGPSQFNAELLRGIWRENPIFVVVLGMCPTLAVTNTLYNGFMMGLCTFAVLVPSMFLISLARKLIPPQVRISAFIVIIANFVTMVDFGVQALSLELHKALGAFISLIVVNCIILQRLRGSPPPTCASRCGPFVGRATGPGRPCRGARRTSAATP